MTPYKHPREIDDFNDLSIKVEPTVLKAKSDIPLLKNGDAPRDWQIGFRWAYSFGPKALFFTKPHRESPSAMATKLEYELAFIGSEWRLRGPDLDRSVSRSFVDELVPSEFSDWLNEQERPVIRSWERAA